MAALAEKAKAEKHINMRVQPQLRDLIDRAAAALGKSRTEFMIDAARERAIDVLLDQRYFELDAAESRALAEALAEPAKPGAALRKLLRSKAPWE